MKPTNDPTESDALISLALQVVEILDRRCKAGHSEASWTGYQNGNGVEVGSQIENLINKAKRILQTYTP